MTNLLHLHRYPMTQTPPPSTNILWPRFWQMAVACFILAGLTGALYRFGLVLGLPWGLQLGNVRHAHSHLMYFSWTTPALMALIAARLPEILPVGWELRPRRFYLPISLAFLFGLAAYPFFLLYGYQPIALGAARLPLAAMIGTLNTVAWYGFIWAYLRTTWGAPRHLPLKFWDGAVVMMLLASLGGWGLAISGRLGGSSLFVNQALTHLFLDLFAEGWLVLGVLGLAYATQADRAKHAAAPYALKLLLLGLPVAFLLTIPVGLVPPLVRGVGSIGGLLVGVGLLLQVWLLRPRQTAWTPWHFPLAFLALRALMSLTLTLPQLARWTERMNLRISYLHWLLLGFVTLGLVAAALEQWPHRPGIPWRPLSLSVGLIIVSLIPLTRLWPEPWAGVWAVWLAAIVALIPVLIAIPALRRP